MFHGVSSSGFELREWPSERAKQVSDCFVGYLSQKDALPVSTLHKKPEIISAEKKAGLLKIFNYAVVDHLYDSYRQPSEEFYLVARGKHYTVWGHTKYPKLVFKLMPHEKADKQKEVACKSREVTRGLTHSWVQIPRADSFKVGGISVYVEEKLPIGLGFEEHKEFWARVISHYQSSNATESFKSHFENLIEHINVLIDKVGFWNVGYNNLPEVRFDGKGVCGTGFSNIDFELKNLPNGLSRLASLVPISPFLETLSAMYEEQVPFLHKQALDLYEREKVGNYLKEPKQEEIMQKFHLEQAEQRDALEALQTALAFYDKKAWVHGAEAIPDSTDLTGLETNEQILANYLIKKFQGQLKKTETKQCLSKRRSLHVQPGICRGCPDAYTREGFLKVLKALKEQALVVSWYDNFAYKTAFESDPSYTSYFIYF